MTGGAPGHGPLNEQLAERLREAASLLGAQGANPFRVGAYRRAADTLEALTEDVAELLDREGVDGLVALPGIGRGLAGAIDEMVHTGRWSLLERLRGTLDPVQVFQAIPGVGPVLAERLHDALHVDTLEALEAATVDGRLDEVPGVGPVRAAMIRANLAAMLARTRPRRAAPGGEEPGVDVLLDVDREYREQAAAGALRTLAPRRFNPQREAWLPILHAKRGDWELTAMFSNTARAHELGRTRDWVVLYFHGDHEPEGQRTVVTETRGPLEGERVVRGRELECRAYYRARDGG